MTDNTEPTPKATANRQIRVFVSSTFRDMKAERDYLVKFIFPQLRRLCDERQEAGFKRAEWDGKNRGGRTVASGVCF